MVAVLTTVVVVIMAGVPLLLQTPPSHGTPVMEEGLGCAQHPTQDTSFCLKAVLDGKFHWCWL